MEAQSILGRLARWEDPAGALVTLTLDVSGSGILPTPARLFLKDHVRGYLESAARPAPVRETLRRIRRRIWSYVESDLKPETEGLFLVAGADAWEAVELGVPIRNFVHAGPAPYLAPLLEALERSPRAYIFRATAREGLLQEFHLGRWTERDRMRPTGMVGVERDAERLISGRAAGSRKGPRWTRSGIGGGRRDRFARTVDEAAQEMVGSAARRVGALHSRAPGEAVYAFCGPGLFSAFQSRLPASLLERVRHLGGPARQEGRLRAAVRRQLEASVRDRLEAEVLEFHLRRAQGCLVALGPSEVLACLETGRLARVMLDAFDPVPGLKCASCGRRYPGLKARCGFCAGELAAASMTQEVVAHALTRPPLAITFVPGPAAGWLRTLGGMAALLADPRIRTRSA